MPTKGKRAPRFRSTILRSRVTGETNHALEELQEIGRKTAAAVAEQEQTYRLWARSKIQLIDTVQRFVKLVYQTDVSAFREEQFVAADEIIRVVVGSLERYLTAQDHRDASHLHLIGEVVLTLRDARGWIVQGLSPDPTKRPSYEDRERMTAAAAERALRALYVKDV